MKRIELNFYHGMGVIKEIFKSIFNIKSVNISNKAFSAVKRRF